MISTATKHAVILAVCCALLATITLVTPPMHGVRQNGFDPATVPAQLGEWTSIDVPVDEAVLRELDPDRHGDTLSVVSRHYTKGGDFVDVLFMAGSTSSTFHNPHVCFPTQGFTITVDKPVRMDVGGAASPVNARILAFRHDDGSDQGVMLYWFRMSDRTCTTTTEVRWSQFMNQLLGRGSTQGYLIRFVTAADTTEEGAERLKAFATEFIRALQKAVPDAT